MSGRALSIAGNPTPMPLIGDSAVMSELRRQITRAARTRLSVLIEGPSGCGKELVAQGLHIESGRLGRLVAFNVCAVADGMFEDALFGHVRGAFSGAIAENAGYCEEAGGGSLFLDEIGALGLAQQAKLLRVVETKTYRKVGARSDQHSDFRLISASNVSLEELAHASMFRSDLLHRLAGIVIRVPPLDDHVEDIPALARHFAELATAPGHTVAVFSWKALELLQSHAWPGNIRELKSVIERAVAFATTPRIGPDDVQATLETTSRRCAVRVTPRHHRVVDVLIACEWDTVRAASALGVNRSSIYRALKRLGITRREAMSGTSRCIATSESERESREGAMRIRTDSHPFACE